jgi:hypothetical protein
MNRVIYLLVESILTMDSNKERMVVCCFCGDSLELKEAVRLIVYPLIDQDESQELFAHREHLVAKLYPSVPLHPDLLGD